jgi:toxin ParE1/3/4
MATEKVEFQEDAALEFLSAVDWYFDRSELVAFRFEQQVSLAIELIARSPQRWPAYVSNTRKFVLRQFPYSIIYRELPDAIQIVAIAHARRRPGYWKARS